jgi:SAM-dependent methyltransferase
MASTALKSVRDGGINPIPLPPLEFRRLVGPTDPADFDNATGRPVYDEFDIPLQAYDSVFDFGCGCGRMARKLLMQTPKPRRYVGIDVHRDMLTWCQTNLSSYASNFEFFHHDVYSPSYSPGNQIRLAAPFPAGDGSISLFIAHSVFTHLYKRQTEYYLRELARILKSDGIAFTSWFLFDRINFPMFTDGPYALLANDEDPTRAVIYDREWLLENVRAAGLAVKRTVVPTVPGHQWTVFLTRRTKDSVDQFPLGAEAAEMVCGATWKTVSQDTVTPAVRDRNRLPVSDPMTQSSWPEPPTLFPFLEEIARLEKLRRLPGYQAARTLVRPVRKIFQR